MVSNDALAPNPIITQATAAVNMFAPALDPANPVNPVPNPAHNSAGALGLPILSGAQPPVHGASAAGTTTVDPRPPLFTSTSSSSSSSSMAAPSPYSLVRSARFGHCYLGIPELLGSEAELAAYPDSPALLSHPRPTPVRNLVAGDLYLVGIAPSACAIIRYDPHMGASQYAAVVIDGEPNPHPAGVIAPLLEMGYIFEPLLGDSISTTVRVVSSAFLDSVLNNQELLRLRRVHRATRLAPAVATLGWFPASPPPAVRPFSTQLPSPIISSSAEYPRYTVQDKQIQFRRGGPGGLSQQLADTAIGVVAVPKDHMRHHGLSDALVRAISPAPDAALFANTISGTYAYIYRVTRSALPLWDFTYLIGHSWQLPTDFDVALLSPLSIAFPDSMALESFQRELMTFDESKKAAFAARFASVSSHLFGFDVEHLRRALYTYIHIIFAVTLMRAALQDRITMVADRLVAIVSGAIRGPFPLSRSLLMAAFAIFRDALREFLAQSGASVLAEDLPARLDHFERTANSVDSNSYLRRLFRSNSDLHQQGHTQGPFLIQSYLITTPSPSSTSPAASSAVPTTSTRAEKRAEKRKRSVSATPSKATAPSSTASPSPPRPPQQQPRVATPATYAVAPPASSATAQPSQPSHICNAFNGVDGCRRENCLNEHVCPVRGTPPWQTLYSYVARLHALGTLRNPPAVAFLQGAPWPPAATSTAVAARP